MAWIGVVTNEGNHLITRFAQGGHTLAITGATVGSGTVSEANMRIQTAVMNEKDDASIINAEELPGQQAIKYRIQVGPASASVGAYVAHQVGLWAKLDSESLVLLMLLQDADAGVSVPLKSDSEDFAFSVYALLQIGNRDSITVEIDESAYVSVGMLNNRLADIEDKIDAMHPVKAREDLVSPPEYVTGGIGDWHDPGTTWTATKTFASSYVSRSFTAPAGYYACALYVYGVTAKSSITEAWFDAGDEQYVSARIEYETIDDGWILLTTKTIPTRSVYLNMMIMK